MSVGERVCIGGRHERRHSEGVITRPKEALLEVQEGNVDLYEIQGRSEQLVGRIQERYGIARDEAQRQVDEWAPNTGRV